MGMYPIGTVFKHPNPAYWGGKTYKLISYVTPKVAIVISSEGVKFAYPPENFISCGSIAVYPKQDSILEDV
jgi:hypothetical protein